MGIRNEGKQFNQDIFKMCKLNSLIKIASRLILKVFFSKIVIVRFFSRTILIINFENLQNNSTNSSGISHELGIFYLEMEDCDGAVLSSPQNVKVVNVIKRRFLHPEISQTVLTTQYFSIWTQCYKTIYVHNLSMLLIIQRVIHSQAFMA